MNFTHRILRFLRVCVIQNAQMLVGLVVVKDHKNGLVKNCYQQSRILFTKSSVLGAVHLRWAGTARRDGWPRWSDSHPVSYGISYFTSKRFLRNWKKIILITYLLSIIFLFSMWFPKDCGSIVLLHTVISMWPLSFFTNFHGILLIWLVNQERK